jgi:acyl carrier protein
MATATVSATSDVRERLARLVDENELLTAGTSQESWESNLFEIGLVDSMGLVLLLELIREEFGVEVDLSMLTAELTSLEAIARYLDRH